MYKKQQIINLYVSDLADKNQCFGKLDDMIELVSKVFAPRCQCGRKKKK